MGSNQRMDLLRRGCPGVEPCQGPLREAPQVGCDTPPHPILCFIDHKEMEREKEEENERVI